MITVGCDPEIIYHHDGVPRSVAEVLPGHKYEPHPVRGGSIHPDNVTGEFNMPAHRDVKSFILNVEDVKGQLDEMVLSLTGFAPTTTAFAVFDDSELESALTRIAGCEPDFNIYTGEMQLPPDLWSTNARAAGGHIHMGLPLNKGDVPRLIKACDFMITLPMLHLEGPDRRVLYGKAGSFRRKEYGVEYRTPSNAWVMTRDRIQWAFEMTQAVAKHFKKLMIPADVQSIIDQHRVDDAVALCKKHDLPLCPV